jgi:EAL domain-containing protein (putative c-di-GMP-specific phosphodiesterase class I)
MFALSGRLGASVDLDHLCCEIALNEFAGTAQGGKLFLNVLPSTLDAENGEPRGLLARLRRSALQPSDVVLEVSEREAEVGSARFLGSVARCRREGFGLSLDDVGTGRTDLAALEQARPDYLKLDSSLVRDIHRNWVRQDLLASLVALAERSDAAVIAEGVETEAEVVALREGGARYGQGFLFAPPAPSPRSADRHGARGH